MEERVSKGKMCDIYHMIGMKTNNYTAPTISIVSVWGEPLLGSLSGDSLPITDETVGGNEGLAKEEELDGY